MNAFRRTLLVAAAALVTVTGAVSAQDKWPSKPITYLVPFPPGGTTDVLGRFIGQKLGPALGATVIIDNRAGAGGSIGSALGARAAADGYTIVGGTISSHAINVSLYPKIGYDPVKDYVPVAGIGTLPLVLAVKADSPFKTVQDVIKAAQAGKHLTAASAGNGTSQHLSLELFKLKSGLKDLTHVPYKGSGPMLQDAIGGQFDMMFETSVGAIPHIHSGRLRALAVTSAKRNPQLPDVPTMMEAGLKDFDVSSWQAVFMPAATPKPIVERLSAEITKILATPEAQEYLAKQGIAPNELTREQFFAFQKAEIAKWAQVIKTAGIHLE
jgi:tripartite-type tricarboxylate transporter receptor subunit TctC